MVDLIDRAALLEALEYDPEKRAIVQPKSTFGIILSAPVVDAVEVVRCKDCEYWMYEYDDVGLCCADAPDIDGVERTALNYCSTGERRTDANTD